jgi:hypothetical protein
MKTRFALVTALSLAVVLMSGCENEKEDPGVALGAQSNTDLPGFYAVGENSTYTMSQAADSPGLIDIFCFYEAETGNNIALAAPGTGITGIFTGDDAPENWTIKNTTFFFQTTLTEEQFNAVQNGDMLIETSFDSENARRKAKDLQAGQVWSFHTEDDIYGLLLVSVVNQGANGSVTFFVKTK